MAQLNEMKDIEIIERCIDGYYKDYNLLVKRYQKSVLLTAVSISGNIEEAEDIAQESFIKAYKNLNNFDKEKSFKSWILSIAYRTGIDTYRRKRTFLKIFNVIKQEHSNNNNPGFKSIEDSEIFAPILKVLNLKERAALSLQINENYTAREIAKVLNCSENTARVHIFNAKKKIKKEMGGRNGTKNN